MSRHEPVSIPLPRPWIHEGIVNRDHTKHAIREAEDTLEVPLPEHREGEARWDRLRNTESGLIARVRVHRPTAFRADITAVIFTTEDGSEPIQARAMRDFPISAISEAFMQYEFAAEASFHEALSGRPLRDVLRPIGRPTRGNPEYYAQLAQQYRALEQTEDDPVQAVADLNGAPRGTVKRWLAEARRRELLPPGKPGRRVGRGGA